MMVFYMLQAMQVCDKGRGSSHEAVHAGDVEKRRDQDGHIERI
jgi:hypothetical protein